MLVTGTHSAVFSLDSLSKKFTKVDFSEVVKLCDELDSISVDGVELSFDLPSEELQKVSFLIHHPHLYARQYRERYQYCSIDLTLF